MRKVAGKEKNEQDDSNNDGLPTTHIFSDFDFAMFLYPLSCSVIQAFAAHMIAAPKSV